jgi:hypothetical protein
MMDSYSSAKLSALFDACGSASGSYARGAALEDLVEYAFLPVPGVKLYARDVRDENGSQEVDLVFTHLQSLSSLPMPDVTIIVECKNENKRTSAAHVREFGNKLRTRSMNIGILVTSAGLSGRPGQHGHAAIRDELQNGVAIIVVVARELTALDMPHDLARLLTSRLNELRTLRGYRSI